MLGWHFIRHPAGAGHLGPGGPNASGTEASGTEASGTDARCKRCLRRNWLIRRNAFREEITPVAAKGATRLLVVMLHTACK